MKQTLRAFLTITAVFAAAIIFSSCTRDFTCQCTITYSGKAGLPDPIKKEYSIPDTKKEAATKCEAHSSEKDVDGVKTKEECTLW